MKKLFFLLSLFLICFQGRTQVIYGANNYIQYHIGTLPIIISAPHGGQIAPISIPDRTCNNPTTVWDNNTIELARQIDTALFNLTGCRPHLIICNLKRTKIDCNRNLADGACGNIVAENAWTEFFDFIDTAQFIVKNQFSNKAFYIDLHAHGHAIKNLELGYGISINNLNNTDSVLNLPSIIATCSLNNLASNNVSGSTNAQLIRGSNSLGTLFANSGFPSVPSQPIPNPGTNQYFTGGYNTQHHTCILPGNIVNGLQIETPSTVWTSYSSRKKFADSTASVLVSYLLIHQNLNLLANCGSFSSVLPIELIDFSGSASIEKNRLFWTTATETNNDYFTLMKSSNGINFEPIAKIKAAGNSTRIINYYFDDTNLTTAISYYKLQQTDYDGQFAFTKIIAINNLSNNIYIFPNPASKFIQLSFSELANNFDVEIANMLGEIFLKTSNQYKLDVSQLPKGIYLMKIINKQKNTTYKKIVLQ